MTTTIPRLLSAKQIAQQTGQPRAYAERLMRRCGRIVRNGRTTCVYENDLLRVLDEMTVEPERREEPCA